LELGDADAVAKVIGKKLGEKKSKKNGKPVKGKVSKK
jgi:dolichol kinase